MKHTQLSKVSAAVMAAAMTLSAAPTAIPSTAVAADTSTGKVIYATDFEDGDVSYFTNRGENDTTEISASTEAAVSGSTSLLASGRSESWNGPAFRLDLICEPNTQYLVSASVKGRYYTSATFSFQYSDSDGEPHYSNLVQNLNGGDWQTIENIPVSFTDDMTEVYVYFEGGSDDLFIDDFSIAEAPSVDIENDIPSLAAIFANDFKVGTALTPDDLASKPFMELQRKHFSESITVGNEMKPDYVLNQAATLAYLEETGDDENPQVNFSAAKPVLNYCDQNNIPVRVHTLVWHSQTPEWFFKEGYQADAEYVSKEKMLKRMENYIKNFFETLTSLYPNIDFYACDVVNEAWLENGTPRQAGHCGSSNNYAASDWVAVFGDNSFIEPAFTYARKYAPKGCKLYYNDYNEYMDKKTVIYEMAMELKEKGVIDGIGMQSHLDARQSLDAAFPSVSMYEQALALYASTGLDIQVTELDATVPDQSGSQYFDVQADYYKGIFNAIVKYKDNISAVIFWGITDTKSWRAAQNPLIFDADFMAKPAYYSIIEGREIPDVVTTTTKATTAATTTTTTIVYGDILYGDANTDNKVTVADAVAILQSLGNKDKYPLSDLGATNADCCDPGDGITPMDALAIQKLDAGVIKSLPEYTTK